MIFNETGAIKHMVLGKAYNLITVYLMAYTIEKKENSYLPHKNVYYLDNIATHL